MIKEKLTVGDLVISDDRVWRVGLLNFSRARLDPITKRLKDNDRFTNFASIDVGPTAMLESAEDYEFDIPELERLIKLVEDAEMSDILDEERKLTLENKQLEALEADRVLRFRWTAAHSAVFADDNDQVTFNKGVDVMPVAEAPVAGKATAAQSIKEKNKARLEALRLKKEETTKARTAEKATKPPRPAAKDKEPKVLKPCQCGGCDAQTTGYFAPGHDARFKGWLLKIEKGDAKREELLEPAVIAKYKWVPSGLEGKSGKGFRPTTNYKGEPHNGYWVDRDAAAE